MCLYVQLTGVTNLDQMGAQDRLLWGYEVARSESLAAF